MTVMDRFFDLRLASSSAVRACNSYFSPEIEQAWEQVVSAGINYLYTRFNA